MLTSCFDRRGAFARSVPALAVAACLLACPRPAWLRARVTQASVQAAIVRGRANLLPRLARQVSSAPSDYPMGRIALSLAAVLKAGAPHDNPTVKKALKKLATLPLRRTYSVACYLFALDAYWQSRYRAEIKKTAKTAGTTGVGAAPSRIPRSGPVRKEMEELVAWLVRGSGGTWNYGGRGRGDHSNTQFAILGLDVGLQNDIPIPAEVFRAIGEHFVATHVESSDAQEFTITYKTPAWEGVTTGVSRRVAYRGYLGMWGYMERSSLRQTMTAAGVSSLLVARRALRKAGEYSGDLAWKVDRKIESGLGWIAANWKEYLGGRWMYYGLYSVEKVGDIGEIESFGRIHWYGEGARFLLRQQKKDGSWGDEVNTAFALLFLTRATRSHLQTMGPPVLYTRVEGGAEEEATDLVYIDKVKGFVSTRAIFEFLTETRDPKLLPIAEEAVQACPPHRIHDILVRLAALWAEPRDAVTRFAERKAAELTGVKSVKREDCTRLAAQARKIREMERKGAATPGEAQALLEGTSSPVLKRRLLDVIDRLGLVDAFAAVIDALADDDADVRRRAHEVLKVWTGLDLPAAAGAWRAWWESEGAAFRVARKVGVLIDRINEADSPEARKEWLERLVKVGRPAAAPVLEAMKKGSYCVDLVKALEAITGQSAGLRPSDWKGVAGNSASGKGF